jgi:hypothetical protein
MPNHFHGIIIKNDPVGASLVDAQDHCDVDAPNHCDVEAPDRSDVDAHNETISNNKNYIENNNNVDENDYRAGTRPAPTFMLGDIIGAFKSITTNEYIVGVKNHNWKPFNKKLWQRNYYERIIRNEMELNAIRQYIINNPLNWQGDSDNPHNWAKKK